MSNARITTRRQTSGTQTWKDRPADNQGKCNCQDVYLTAADTKCMISNRVDSAVKLGSTGQVLVQCLRHVKLRNGFHQKKKKKGVFGSFPPDPLINDFLTWRLVRFVLCLNHKVVQEKLLNISRWSLMALIIYIMQRVCSRFTEGKRSCLNTGHASAPS